MNGIKTRVGCGMAVNDESKITENQLSFFASRHLLVQHFGLFQKLFFLTVIAELEFIPWSFSLKNYSVKNTFYEEKYIGSCLSHGLYRVCFMSLHQRDSVGLLNTGKDCLPRSALHPSWLEWPPRASKIKQTLGLLLCASLHASLILLVITYFFSRKQR